MKAEPPRELRYVPLPPVSMRQDAIRCMQMLTCALENATQQVRYLGMITECFIKDMEDRYGDT